jgi:PAS domain S-box-containing protein
MLGEILKNPDFQEYISSFYKGQILFFEGDDTQDLFILISGELDVLKGNNKIAEVVKSGEMFGEMSFLMGAKRTATVKARSEGQLVRIPKHEINTFLAKFPDTARSITQMLARRLDETSQVLFGLKEFCDQLTDAVVLTNREGEIMTWNAAAEKIYGRSGPQMQYKPIEEIYEEPEEYSTYIEAIHSGHSKKEKTLMVRHPEKGIRYISTSGTMLYGGQHNFQGVLFLGRDVTTFVEVEKKYHRIRNRIIPSLLIVLLFVAGIYFLTPYLMKNRVIFLDENKGEFRNQLGKDFVLLSSLIKEPFINHDIDKTSQIMREFFDIQESGEIPYSGLVLLDKQLKVFDAYSLNTQKEQLIGSSYSGIDFQGNSKSYHKVLTLYRSDKEHPMGRKGVEVAFEIDGEDGVLGWLVFQMNMEFLRSKYGITGEDIKKFYFEKKN